jgi:hypothetical protein
MNIIFYESTSTPLLRWLVINAGQIIQGRKKVIGANSSFDESESMN